ncbi:MAG: 50S ribosomal protein L18 [Patescibacteria group bacterium]
MKKAKLKNQIQLRRKKRVRAKISGTKSRPRLSVFRSLKHIYAQLIDDEAGKTIVSASDGEVKTGKTKTEKAAGLGKIIAEKALAKGVKQAVFDKGEAKYHGRIKAVADGARNAGLKI